MKNLFISFLFIINFQIGIIISFKRNLSPCSSNCLVCASSTVCTQCIESYVLKGTNENDANDPIDCVPATSVTTEYFKSSTGIYYHCNSNPNYV